MKVIILTTSVHGTTGHHLPALYAASGIEVAMVVVSEGQVGNRKKQYLKRIKKILKSTTLESEFQINSSLDMV